SAANSIVSNNPNDEVGLRDFGFGGSNFASILTGITVLPNHNYIVDSNEWTNPNTPASKAGAVTWGNGATGTAGMVSTANSLIGASSGDRIGLQLDPSTNFGVSGIVIIPGTSNVIVLSPQWTNRSTGGTNAGAITFVNGTTGLLVDGTAGGAVGATNSLIGQ